VSPVKYRLAGGMLPSLGDYVAINKVLWDGCAAPRLMPHP
jgi:hypothetical protein